MVKGHTLEEIQQCQKIDTLQRLFELIYDHAHQLRLAFEKHETKIEGSKLSDGGYVSYKDWMLILKEVLLVDLEWGVLSHYLITPEIKIEHDNQAYIHFPKFLIRFFIKLDDRLTEWQDDVVNSLVTHFVNSTKTVKDMFEEYDINKDKKISYDEFWKGISQTDFGDKITEAQCYELMGIIDKDHNGYIDYEEFKHYFGPKFDRFEKASPWLKTTIAELAKKLVQKHKNIKQSFLIFDADRDNRITYNEFSNILKRDLDGESFTSEQRQEIFRYVDENNSKSISYKEFKTAFEGSNAEKFSKRQNFEISAKNMIMYHICTAVRKSRTQLTNIWSELDTSKEHHVTKNEFLNALKAVNVHLKNDPDLHKVTIADEQMQKLYIIIDTKNQGYINYLHFLELFELHIN
jgi:Ca2+-binding EF-hand superfamily protein